LPDRTIKLAASYVCFFNENDRFYNVEIRSDWLSKTDAYRLAVRLKEELGLSQKAGARIEEWSKRTVTEPSDLFGGVGTNPSVDLGMWRGLDLDGEASWSVSITLFFFDPPK